MENAELKANQAKAICPVAGCGKKFITSAHAVSHADVAHPNWIEERHKRKGWATPYGFADFTYPVTYEEAYKVMAEASQQFFGAQS